MVDKGEAHIDDPEWVRFERMLHDAERPDDRTRAYLGIGALCERRRDWDRAVGYYV